MLIFLTIWKIGKIRFFSKKKSQLFFENIFRPEKIKILDGIFFKFMSWSRRIILKRLQDNSGSIKCRKVMRKKCWSYKFEPFWGHFAIWPMHDTRGSGCPTWKNQDILICFPKIKIFKIIFLQEKSFFLIQIFFYDLEFIYTFDLSRRERLRECTGNGRVCNSKKLFFFIDIWQVW